MIGAALRSVFRHPEFKELILDESAQACRTRDLGDRFPEYVCREAGARTQPAKPNSDNRKCSQSQNGAGSASFQDPTTPMVPEFSRRGLLLHELWLAI